MTIVDQHKLMLQRGQCCADGELLHALPEPMNACINKTDCTDYDRAIIKAKKFRKCMNFISKCYNSNAPTTTTAATAIIDSVSVLASPATPVCAAWVVDCEAVADDDEDNADTAGTGVPLLPAPALVVVAAAVADALLPPLPTSVADDVIVGAGPPSHGCAVEKCEHHCDVN